jgi:hypothetical protein
MMRSPIEVELHQRGGSVINVMQRVSPITIQLLKALFVPLTLTLTLQSNPAEAFDLADQLRLLARTDKRISYIIFNSKIASWKKNYKWRKYTGINPHKTHIHISFTAKGDRDGSMFEVPILTGEPLNGTSKASKRKLGEKLFSRRNSNLFSGGLGCTCNCKCSVSSKPSSNIEMA